MSSDSVASIVRDYVSRDACLMECLGRGIVNYSEAARRIAYELQREHGIRVSVSAVKMALIRLSRRLAAKGLQEVERVVACSRLALQDDVVVVTVNREELGNVLGVVSRLLASSRFIQVTQSLRTATIVVAREDYPLIQRVLRSQPLEVVEGQTVIIIVSPREIVSTPGVVAYITGFLSRHGVNITQIISCHVDTMIVLDSSDAARAYKLLYEAIERLRSRYGPC